MLQIKTTYPTKRQRLYEELKKRGRARELIKRLNDGYGGAIFLRIQRVGTFRNEDTNEDTRRK